MWMGHENTGAAGVAVPEPAVEVRKTCRPRSWANFSLLWLYSHMSAWASLHRLGQPKTLLGGDRRGDLGHRRDVRRRQL